MNAAALAWSRDSICLRPRSLEPKRFAADVYERTCRTDFSAPGFCVVSAGRAIGSVGCRQLMVDLKRAMASIHEAATGETLIFLSAVRADQQTTTKPHLDGGPDECLLMLGYEPSEVDAELEISDYAKCAFDLGLSPQEFMAQHNPMFQSGYLMLRPYTVRIPCYSQTDYQIICINNSSAPFSRERRAWQGTLHSATIPTPDETRRRVVNSMLVATAPAGAVEPWDAAQQDEFIASSRLRPRGYEPRRLDGDNNR